MTIAAVLILWGAALSPARQGQLEAQPGPPLSLERAADQADRLSDEVYSGLDTTKKIIGKTEARNQAIEKGRDAASQKLAELSDRARQAETASEDVLTADVLTATDKRVLKHISE
jgi:hypothetical protein